MNFGGVLNVKIELLKKLRNTFGYVLVDNENEAGINREKEYGRNKK